MYILDVHTYLSNPPIPHPHHQMDPAFKVATWMDDGLLLRSSTCPGGTRAVCLRNGSVYGSCHVRQWAGQAAYLSCIASHHSTLEMHRPPLLPWQIPCLIPDVDPHRQWEPFKDVAFPRRFPRRFPPRHGAGAAAVYQGPAVTHPASPPTPATHTSRSRPGPLFAGPVIHDV